MERERLAQVGVGGDQFEPKLIAFHDELVRDLADYDRAFGLTDDEEEVA